MPAAPLSALAEHLRTSLRELRESPAEYTPLILQLDRLLEKAERGELDLHALREAQAEFLRFPRLQPTRAAAATDDGLEATRSLLVEIKNRIVSFDDESTHTKAKPSEASRARSEE